MDGEHKKTQSGVQAWGGGGGDDTVIYPATADLFSMEDVWKKATLEPHELITKFRETLP